MNLGTCPFFITPKKQSKTIKMSSIAKINVSSAEERRAYLDLSFQKSLEEKITKPLSPEATTDALKLKELRKRFPFADFHVTDPTMGLYYKVDFNNTSVDWMPEMLWYKSTFSWFEDHDNGTPFYYFPRPCKIEITTGGFTKDVTHLFN